MNMTKVTQLAGVRYLLNTVATGDRPSAAQGGMSAYYTAAGTPPGRWWGAGASAIGLADGLPVTHSGAEALFSRFEHPVTGAPLGGTPVQLHAAREQVSAKRVSGFDLTFRMPKSISVLWGTADEHLQAQILHAHHAAIDQTLAWVESDVLRTRSGRGGLVASPVVGMLAARFDHWDTREGDPHLHSHVVVANRVQRLADGKWMTVDGAALYRAAVAASELHENLLLDELHERLGLVFTERARDVTGRATRSVVVDVAGVPSDVVDHFSSRAAQIEQVERELVTQWVEEHGGTQPSRRAMDRIHQRAWAATRRPKDKTVRPLGDLVATWRRQLRALGHEPRDLVAAATGHDRSPASTDRVVADPTTMERLAARLLERLRDDPRAGDLRQVVDEFADAAETVVAAVVEGRATWTRSNLRAEAERMTRLVRCSRGERASVIDAITDAAAARCIPLTPTRYQLPEQAIGDARVDVGGGVAGMDDPGVRRFTHQRVLDAETYLHALASDTPEGVPHLNEQGAVAALEQLPADRPLAADQRAAALAVTCDPRRLSAIVGPAGTGKTTTMAAVRACWEAEHGAGSVVGLATSARAAAELSAALDVQAHTVAKFLWETSPQGLGQRAERRQRALTLRASRRHRDRDVAARILTETDVDDATFTLRPGQLVIVDEASMTGTFDLAQVARQAEAAGAKLLLVGDPAQLDSPAAGGMLGWLDRSDVAANLSSVWRFHEEWEAAASLNLRAGDSGSLLTYDEHGRLVEGGTQVMLDGAYAAVRDARRQGRTAILIAATNDQVADLNTRFTLDRRADGEVDTSTLTRLRAGADAGVGEIVLARKVDRRLRDSAGVPIRNGDLLTIASIGRDGSVHAVRNDDTHATIHLPSSYLQENVELGYATTAHRAQGITVDEGHVAIAYGERMTRELLYVAMTRGRRDNRVWVGIPDDDELRGEHQVVTDRPDRFTVLSRALAAETAERTAHEVAAQAHLDAHHLGRLVAEHEYLTRWHAAPALLSWLRAEVGDEQAELLESCPAWDSLVATWTRAQAIDPARAGRLLRIPIASPQAETGRGGQGVLFGPSDGAPEDPAVLDPAALLQNRLSAAIVQPTLVDPDAPGWVGGLVPVLRTDDTALADLARQCEDLIDARVRTLMGDLSQSQPRWVAVLDPKPSDPDRAAAWAGMVRAVAVYRDTYQVAGDLPLGPRPYSTDRRRDRQWLHASELMSTWDRSVAADASSQEWPDHDPWADVDWSDPNPITHAWDPQLDDTVDAPAVIDAPDLDDVETVAPAPAAEIVDVDRLTAVNAAAWDLWRASAPTSWVPMYLHRRGLDVDAGHAPAGWSTTVDALRARGFSDADLLQSGLASVASTGRLIDRFRDRLAFPVRDGQDRILAFTARANPAVDDPHAPKYLNTPETPAYNKGSTLFGLDEAARARLAAGAVPVLVEGAMDHAAVRALGDRYVPLAPCGTAVTESQLEQLREATPDGLARLVVALDADTAGTKAAARVWHLLHGAEAASVRGALLPVGADPAELVERGRLDELAAALQDAGPLTHVVIDRAAAQADLTHVAGRLALVRAVARSLATLPSDAVMAATAHLQSVVGDGLLASTVMAEVVDAYTPVQAAPDDLIPPSVGGAPDGRPGFEL